VAVGQQGRAESRRTTAVAQRGRAADSAPQRAEPAGPAFISDQAEEQHHHDLLRDPGADQAARAAARFELARLYERRGQFADAAEMYEQNVWAGARTPATYAGLVAAYRDLGRDDLADAALEQIRREGGVGRTASTRTAAQTAPTGTLPRQSRTQPGPATARRAGNPRVTGRRASAGAGTRTPSRRTVQVHAEPAISGATLGQIHRGVAPFLQAQAGHRTLVMSTVLLPILLGLGVFVAVVLASTRSRSTETVPAPTPAPVAAAAPAAAPTALPTPAVPAALAQPPAPARLVVSDVGPEGLSIRRSPNTAGQRIKVWSDGTEMADLGETAENGGKSWRKVRDPDGNVGWTAAEFLADPSARASAPARPAFASGGLGLSRDEWETAHGEPTRSSIFLEYAGGRLVVGLLDGNVWHIERVWPRGDAVSLDAARAEASAYLPQDATQVQSVDRGDGRIIDVYSSAQLPSRFASTAWNGGKTGTFSIQYRFRSAADRMVTSAMFRLGDALF
jgi:hypothetical protein